MTPPERYTTKRERKLETALGTVRNAFPGRKPIWELDRIALLLDMDGNDEDAAILRDLGERLTKVRIVLRGKSRHDYEREAGDRLKGPLPDDDSGRPFA